MADYRIVKGDTIESVAKRNGIADWKKLWNAPENRALVARRKRPEAIQPGDVLVLPPTFSEMRQAAAKSAIAEKERTARVAVRDAAGSEVVRLKARIKVYDDLIASHRRTTEQIVAELQKNLSGMKGWASGVDAAKRLTEMGWTLGKLCALGAKASKASGFALVRLNKEAADEAMDLAKGAREELLVTVLGTLKDNANAAASALGAAADGWDKVTSPSFWAHVYVQMTDNGKTWSEAVTSDVGDGIRERIRWVQSESDKTQKALTERRQALADRLSKAQQLEKACAARIARCEAEARAAR